MQGIALAAARSVQGEGGQGARNAAVGAGLVGGGRGSRSSSRGGSAAATHKVQALGGAARKALLQGARQHWLVGLLLLLLLLRLLRLAREG